jgi:hypothetical protein
MRPFVYRVENHGNRWTRLSTDGMSGYALSVLQDSVDPDLLFVGTEFGLHVSTNAGESWTKFTAGLPTVSVMDMAIQERESDLVLGTHGRAAYVIDDFSALRNLSTEDFGARLKVLSVSPGQQYNARQSPSSRFTGSGEFRADNEPYGAMLTFIASGEDLPHPDADAERTRKISLRETAARSGVQKGEQDKEDSKPARLSVTIKDADGETIRSYKTDVHQGINRLTWSMQRDGIRPVSTDKQKEPDNDLPAGPMVLPGHYGITLELGESNATTAVEILKDPRSPYSMDDLQANYDARLSLMAMQDAANRAMRQINTARADIETINRLLSRRLEQNKDENLEALKKQAGEVKKALGELEKLYRTPKNTKGITYDGETVAARLGTAGSYVGPGNGAPSATATSYFEMLRSSLALATDRVNTFMAGDLADLRESVNSAGITLLNVNEAIKLPE